MTTSLFASLTMSCLLTVAAAGAQGQSATTLPAHPRDIVAPPLTFSPPSAADFRHTLSDGTVVYLVPDHTFPLISLSVTAVGGQNLFPPEQSALAALAASQMRAGGTQALAPAALDEELDFMASNVSIGASGWTSTASIDCLKQNFDATLALLLDMLKAPRFDGERLRLAKSQVIEGMKQRNDDADTIAGFEWKYLVFGDNTWRGAQPTAAAIDGIDEAALRDAASRIFRPGNYVIAVTGDFEVAPMLATLEKAFTGDSTPQPKNPLPEADARAMPHGLYHAQKDIPQGKVFVGGRSLQRNDSDLVAAMLMNEILGGGGFTSRITKRVRSDEGLAYSAGSGLSADPFALGTFRAGVQSKNATVALSLKLILEEFTRMRDTLVSEEELNTAKRSFIESFPEQFASKAAVAGIFVDDQLTSRPADWWATYRAKVDAVTAQDIQRVAQRLLKPEEMSVLVVGDWETIAPGDENGRASMAEIEAIFGAVQHLPARDPLTMKPVPATN